MPSSAHASGFQASERVVEAVPNPLDESDPNGVDTSSSKEDAGTGPNDHYKQKLSPFRYRLRNRLLPWIRKETEMLYALQTKLRHPVLDFYFAWTANLAAHTFYVLMLPLPIWFGAGTVSRDLVFVLGWGIYITGNFKDFMCLPRPRSPPLHRITMSSYTAQEYGWPSSHSANATAVTLILFRALLQKANTLPTSTFAGLAGLLAVYYVSLIFGRLYCGMHGFFDIAFGSLIGVFVFLVRFLFGEAYDAWLLDSPRNTSWIGCLATLVFIIGIHVWLVHIHCEPVDDCPCFDDLVAFVGVLIGIDLSHWVKYLVSTPASKETLVLPYSFSELGIAWSAVRVVLGILLVVTWKTISKPVVFTILPPIYKLLKLHLPRANYLSTAHTTKTTRQIRSQSLSNMGHNSIQGELKHIISDVMDHNKKDEVGPETDIDRYEMLATNTDSTEKVSGVFKPRYDVETIGRLIVYAGIPVMAYWGFALSTRALNI